MSPRQHSHLANRPKYQPKHSVPVKRFRHGAALSQRSRGLEKNEQSAFAPPETWYEPSESTQSGQDYRIVVQSPGAGYRHVVTPAQIRERLAELPAEMLEPLEVIQLSRMTKKKMSFPCYGMQWGTALYLYPIETTLVEFYGRPPRPAQLIEAKMYGGRWVHTTSDDWQLVWTESAIRDYYLNNILIHELGHLLDNRNCSYTDRERYAEWFAIEHGYRQSKRPKGTQQKRARKVKRRHHSS